MVTRDRSSWNVSALQSFILLGRSSISGFTLSKRWVDSLCHWCTGPRGLTSAKVQHPAAPKKVKNRRASAGGSDAARKGPLSGCVSPGCVISARRSPVHQANGTKSTSAWVSTRSQMLIEWRLEVPGCSSQELNDSFDNLLITVLWISNRCLSAQLSSAQLRHALSNAKCTNQYKKERRKINVL